MRRKSSVGVITEDEAKAVAQCYMMNLQVQSLGQHDRKVKYHNPNVTEIMVTTYVTLSDRQVS